MSGVRVVRGRDWDWGDRDGGEGFVGTVVWQEGGSGRATVQWDTASRHSYCCGYGGKYDLRVLDTAPAGVQHEGWCCNWCSVSPITGTLWQCVQCRSYGLCSRCYHSGRHCLEHEFERVDGAECRCVRVGSRMVARQVMSRGIFPGAVVMRGADWRWEDQDGGIGCRGKVSAIEGWEKTSFRSVAHVTWSHSQVLNIYCVGHNGLVDLQCVESATGGFYYPEHLPILGEESSDAGDEGQLRTGDLVRVTLDPGEFKTAQESHGGWEDYMAEYIGCDGVVHAIHYSGDVVVRYKNGIILQVNPICLTKLEGHSFECGDVVRVNEDMALVHQLQTNHGEWADDMALSLGQVGRVMKVRANGDIRVAVNGSRWIFNPKCLSPAPGETPLEETTGQLHVDIAVRIQTLSLSDASCPDVVVVAASGGDLDTLTKYLHHHPEHVDTMYEGKAAIHAATVEGYLPIIKLLISHRADLNKKDEGELTALNLCAIINSLEATKLLLGEGADVNIADDRGITPLARAAALGHVDIVEILLEQRRTDPNKQDCQGHTALHRAVFSHQLQSVIALLKAGADPTILNHNLQNCLHRASVVGFLAGVEELMKWHPKLINMAKKDGFTPLHIAAANGHTDIVSTLASHPDCQLDTEDTDGLTALHLAAHGGHPVMLERLVGHGADLNSATAKGNTALHFVLNCENMAAPSDLSPHILEVKWELDRQCGQDTLPSDVVVGVFLVKEGAQIHSANRLGVHPLSLKPSDVVQLLNRYATATHSRPSFHGTLRQKESPFVCISPKTRRKPMRVVSREQEPLSSSTITSPPPTSPLPTSPPPPSSSSSHTSTQSRPPVTPVSRQARAVDRSVNENTPSPVLYGKDINPYAKLAAASAIDSVVSGTTCTLDQCSLCEEEPVSIMLQPCGHVTLCIVCGPRAKRCMKKECRANVAHIIKLCPVCLKNQADVAHRACRKDHHRLCRGCIARSSSVCILCSSVVLRAPE